MRITRLGLLLVVQVTSAFAQTGAPGRPDGGAVDFASLFKDRYADPIVNADPTPVKGVWLCETYDRSQMAEDPLIPAYWLVTDHSHRYHQTAEELARALAEVGFVPDSEQAALDGAQLLFAGGRQSVLAGPQGAPGAPKELASRITAPAVTRKGALFVVHLFVRHNDVRARYMNRTPYEPIVEHTIELGTGVFRDQTQQIHPIEPPRR